MLAVSPFFYVFLFECPCHAPHGALQLILALPTRSTKCRCPSLYLRPLVSPGGSLAHLCTAERLELRVGRREAEGAWTRRGNGSGDGRHGRCLCRWSTRPPRPCVAAGGTTGSSDVTPAVSAAVLTVHSVAAYAPYCFLTLSLSFHGRAARTGTPCRHPEGSYQTSTPVEGTRVGRAAGGTRSLQAAARRVQRLVFSFLLPLSVSLVLLPPSVQGALVCTSAYAQSTVGASQRCRRRRLAGHGSACRVESASSVGVIRACHYQAVHVARHPATFIQSGVAVVDAVNERVHALKAACGASYARTWAGRIWVYESRGGGDGAWRPAVHLLRPRTVSFCELPGREATPSASTTPQTASRWGRPRRRPEERQPVDGVYTVRASAVFRGSQQPSSPIPVARHSRAPPSSTLAPLSAGLPHFTLVPRP